ncbi:MAG: hypothetical protein PHQ14_10920 [Chromatiales bacterium]|nr:hypothetical protein [Chromatiales bacterium]MDX9767178.1 hypothetical protein [Ectothiorhodospiraceae bacterium]
MDIRPIKTEADYAAVRMEVEALWGAPADTPEDDRRDVLLTAYETKHHPIAPADPVAACPASAVAPVSTP